MMSVSDWLPVWFFNFSLQFLSACFPFLQFGTPESGSLKVFMSQRVPALCPGGHLWPLVPIFYSCVLFPLVLLVARAPICHHRGLYILMLMGIVELKPLLSVRHFLLVCPPLRQGGTWFLKERVSLAASSPKPVKSSASRAFGPFVLAGLLSKAISLDTSRWQHPPPCALRLA